MFWRNQGFRTFQDFALKRTTPSLGIGNMGSDWSETQDSDPGGLRGPPRASTGGRSGIVTVPLPSSPRPSGKGPGPLSAATPPAEPLPVYLPPVPVLSGICSFYLSPGTESFNKHMYSEPLVGASRFAEGFTYCHI